MKPHVLFVEDDATFRGVLERELRELGWEVVSFATGEEALAYLEDGRAEVALLDLRLPGMSGQEVLEHIGRDPAAPPVVFLTGHGALPDAVAAMRRGAYDFLVKPAPLDELQLTLERALEYGRLLRQNRLLRTLAERDFAQDLLGESKPVQDLRAAIPRVARSDSNVLILGENGTGKELVARALHAASARSSSAFVVVNCGAIPAELFESELFGHRRGAFTGADRERLGLVALADGGTLFLDEVGELPRELQPALLRAVQFGEFRPVGGEKAETADLRLVAATNRDLTAAIEQGTFREDLYHRISTLVVEVPPLRERGDDVQLLANRFLERFNDALPADGKREFTEDALAALRAQRWTGNVRELENVVTRLATLVDDRVIDADDVRRHATHAGRGASPEVPTLDLRELERSAVVQAMRLHGGHRERAAAELGVAVKTLYNKLRTHGIAESEWT